MADGWDERRTAIDLLRDGMIFRAGFAELWKNPFDETTWRRIVLCIGYIAAGDEDVSGIRGTGPNRASA